MRVYSLGIQQAVNTTVNNVRKILHPSGRLVAAHNVAGLSSRGGHHHKHKPETTTEA